MGGRQTVPIKSTKKRLQGLMRFAITISTLILSGAVTVTMVVV